MTSPQDMRDQLEREGRVWMRGAVSAAELGQLETHLGHDGLPGARISLSDTLGVALARLPFVERIRLVWPGMRPVRVLNFDKSAAVNWSVPWHQDRIIAVDRRADLDGHVNWSRKSGVWHCEPPMDLLARMIFVRLHLDASTAGNGAMEIARGSHRAGRVPGEEAERIAGGYETEVTEADPGDVLVLKMLTLHRSPRSDSDAPRRAIRMDFAAGRPQPPLGWAG